MTSSPGPARRRSSPVPPSRTPSRWRRCSRSRRTRSSPRARHRVPRRSRPHAGASLVVWIFLNVKHTSWPPTAPRLSTSADPPPHHPRIVPNVLTHLRPRKLQKRSDYADVAGLEWIVPDVRVLISAKWRPNVRDYPDVGVRTRGRGRPRARPSAVRAQRGEAPASPHEGVTTSRGPGSRPSMSTVRSTRSVTWRASGSVAGSVDGRAPSSTHSPASAASASASYAAGASWSRSTLMPLAPASRTSAIGNPGAHE